MFEWKDLTFWQSGEWQVVEERLKDLEKQHVPVNPRRKDLFRALDVTSFDACRVAIIGQDPYPDAKFATGIAFNTPNDTNIPVTLKMIFDEYCNDLHYPRPVTGSLLKWCTEGVLLWNCIPSCSTGHSLSHDWDEWTYLTTEIIKKLGEKGVVFIFVGSRARKYASLVNQLSNCHVIETVHPSPRANLRNPKHPFVGSRIFTRTNDALVTLGLEPIEWRL